MQIVHLDHVVLGGERVADLFRVEVARGRLEQHAPGLAQQSDPRVQHQPGHEQRGDAVRAAEAGQQDERARDGRRDEREEVVQDVLEGTLDVEAAPVGAGQDEGGDEVHGDSDDGDDQHGRTLDVRWVDEAPDSLDPDQRPEPHERRAVQLRREDLGAPVAEREAALGRPPCEPGREQRQRDRAGVREHVRGVREQRERRREDADHHLARHEGEQEDERDRQSPRIVRLRVPMPSVAVHRRPWSQAPEGQVLHSSTGAGMQA